MTQIAQGPGPWTYVGAAYGLTWVVILGYTIYLNRRVARARAADATTGQETDSPDV